MNGGTKVIDTDAIVRRKKEHARHGRYADLIDIDSWKESHLDIEDRRVAWSNCEPKRGCCTFAIQKRVHDHRSRALGGLFKPEGAECRKLFPFGISCAKR